MAPAACTLRASLEVPLLLSLPVLALVCLLLGRLSVHALELDLPHACYHHVWWAEGPLLTVNCPCRTPP